MILELPDEV